MGRETLSVTQANQIIREANSSLKTAQETIERTANNFLEGISVLWEDENAVTFAKNYNSMYQEMLTIMTSSNKSFVAKTKLIAAKYIRAGGMNVRVTEEALSFSGELNYGIVKNHFTITGNDDDFGFLDATPTGVDRILRYQKKILDELRDAISELNTSIGKINAFGNTDVQQAIAVLTSNIVKKLYYLSEEKTKEIEYLLMKTREDYANVARAFDAEVRGEKAEWPDKIPRTGGLDKKTAQRLEDHLFRGL